MNTVECKVLLNFLTNNTHLCTYSQLEMCGREKCRIAGYIFNVK